MVYMSHFVDCHIELKLRNSLSGRDRLLYPCTFPIHFTCVAQSFAVTVTVSVSITISIRNTVQDNRGPPFDVCEHVFGTHTCIHFPLCHIDLGKG